MKWMLLLFLIVISVGYTVPSRACTPDCAGKQCGDDGCGGTCGECTPPAKCVVGHCVKGCGGLTEAGGYDGSCCYHGKALTCLKEYGGKWFIEDCGSDNNCRWRPISGYVCDSSLPDMEDPTGRQPRECNFTCTPDCAGKDCGDDGCGGSCGACAQGDKCIDGNCCHPNCEGKECRSDGCGGNCGRCHDWELCSDDQKCVRNWGCHTRYDPGCPGCACEKAVCDKDPLCCYWSWDVTCASECRAYGKCGPCTPDCTGKECGDDGCGGKCGYCKSGDKCQDGKCKKCVPDCTGKECGDDDDGCGGSCGECKDRFACKSGTCQSCKPGCSDEADCGVDECGDPCNIQGYYTSCSLKGMEVCRYNACIPCESYCEGRECGDDGCGGSCGTCGPCAQCISHQCKAISGCVAPDQGPEPVPDVSEDVPDVSEDVQVTQDAVEVTDPGKVVDPGKETVSDRPPDTDAAPDSATDSATDKTTRDTAGPDALAPRVKSGSGGCTTAPRGPMGGILLILLLIFGLFARRRRPDIR